jgi:type II secretory pathway pseudopilin PulG
MVQTSRHTQAGFSLMELIAYTAIVLILVAGAAVIIRNLQHGAKVTNTKQALGMVKSAIDGYHARNDDYPDDLNALKPIYLKDVPKDGWKNPLKYKKTEGGKHPYELYSHGSEGPGGDASERIDVWQI